MERAPQEYDFGGYRALFEAVKRVGLRVQAVMSFHACGGNVGDSTQVPLPQWVLQVGDTHIRMGGDSGEEIPVRGCK